MNRLEGGTSINMTLSFPSPTFLLLSLLDTDTSRSSWSTSTNIPSRRLVSCYKLELVQLADGPDLVDDDNDDDDEVEEADVAELVDGKAGGTGSGVSAGVDFVDTQLTQ
jgi:hypothetical protein